MLNEVCKEHSVQEKGEMNPERQHLLYLHRAKHPPIKCIHVYYDKINKYKILPYPVNQEIQISRSNNAVAPYLQYSAVLAPQ